MGTLTEVHSPPRAACLRAGSAYRRLIGVGGIGTGLFFRLEGNRTLGRNESRAAQLLDARDYCKLHIVCHHAATLLGSAPHGEGFHVLPIARVGDDEPGRRAVRELARAGVDVSHVQAVNGLPTLFSVCFQYADGSGGNVTTEGSAASALKCSEIDRCVPVLAIDGPKTIVAAVPEAPLAARDHLLRLGTEYGAYRVASFTSAEIPTACAAGMFARADLVALNQDEAEAVLGEPLNPENPDGFLSNCAGKLGAGARPLRIVITAGRHGAFGLDADEWQHCPAPAVPVVSTAGAGDALLAGTISALVAGMPFVSSGAAQPSALQLGVLLGAFSVTSPHTIHPDANLASLLQFAGARGLSLGAMMRYTCNFDTGTDLPE